MYWRTHGETQPEQITVSVEKMVGNLDKGAVPSSSKLSPSSSISDTQVKNTPPPSPINWQNQLFLS